MRPATASRPSVALHHLPKRKLDQGDGFLCGHRRFTAIQEATDLLDLVFDRIWHRVTGHPSREPQYDTDCGGDHGWGSTRSCASRPYTPADGPGITEILERIHAEDKTDWPPVQRIREFGSTFAWLEAYAYEWRLVADVQNATPQLAGHVAVTVPHDEEFIAVWRNATDLSPSRFREIVRLAVDPSQRNRGVATALMTEATTHIQNSGNLPVLTVLTFQGAAHSLYAKLGWRHCGVAHSHAIGLALDCMVFGAAGT